MRISRRTNRRNCTVDKKLNGLYKPILGSIHSTGMNRAMRLKRFAKTPFVFNCNGFKIHPTKGFRKASFPEYNKMVA